jgi:hypothetical protein
MPSLLDSLLGAPGSMQSGMVNGLTAGLLQRNIGGGLLAANAFAASEPERIRQAQIEAMRMGLLQSQVDENNAQTAQRRNQQAVNDQLQAAARESYVSPDQARLQSTGPMPDGSSMPQVQPGFNTQQFLDRAATIDPFKAMELREKFAPKEVKPLVVGGSLVTPDGKEIYRAPKEHATPSAIQEYEYAKGQGFDGTFADYEMRKRSAGAPRMPAINLYDPTALAQAAVKFQGDVRNAFKDEHAVATSYRAMQGAVKDPSAQGDTALLYSFFKTLDPQSTVREGEIDMVKQSRSIPDKFKGYAQKLANGQTLMPHEREDILTQAQRQVQGRVGRVKNDVAAFRDNAKRLSLDPDLYVVDPYAGLSFDRPQGGTGANPLAAAAAAELQRRRGGR